MIDYRQIFNDFSNLESLNTNENTYNVISLPLMSHKLGMSREGFPMFFVSTTDDDCGTNIIREILLVEYDVECTIKEYDGSSFGNKFSIITLRTLDKCLQSYFVDIFLMMLGKMVEIPSKHELSIEVERLVSIFSALTSAPRKKIQGLWAELLVIEQSKDPGLLINAWHSSTSSKYDFTLGRDKIEVKSTSSEERVHRFSLDQLNPSPNSRLLIASVVVRESGQCLQGLSIKNLYDRICLVISELESKIRLYTIIAQTLGKDIDKIEKEYYDYVAAVDSLSYYNFEDIPRILKNNVPISVTDVKFSCNITKTESIKELNCSLNDSELFKSLF